MIIINSYTNFKYFHDPSTFAYEQLIVSDGMGYECNPSFLIDRNYFNNNLVMFVLRGVLCVEQFGQKHKITENQGILIELTEKHKYYFDKSFDSHIVWFHFRGKPCQELISQLHFNNKMPLIFSAPWVEKEIYRLYDIAESKDSTKEFSISSTIYSIILAIVKESILEIQMKSSDYNFFKDRVDNYLSANLDKQLSLEAMAGHFIMSKYHFCRTFKHKLHSTPFDYIKMKKIEVAKKMLLYTNDSISDISNYLCFYDQGYFSNTFKSVVGCSPRKFRHEKFDDSIK